MYLRIVRRLPPRLEGLDTSRFELDHHYEVHAPLCDLLVLSGYAVPYDEPPPSRANLLKALGGAIIPTREVRFPLTDEPIAPFAPADERAEPPRPAKPVRRRRRT